MLDYFDQFSIQKTELVADKEVKSVKTASAKTPKKSANSKPKTTKGVKSADKKSK